MDVHDELKRLLDHLDQFPDPSAVQQVEGTHASVTAPFRSDLRNVARVASAATKKMMAELAEMDGAVRGALADLSAQDDEMAASAERFSSFLDDAVETSAPGSSGEGRS